MRLRLARLLNLLAAVAVPALAVLPTAAHSEGGPRRNTISAPSEDPDGARVIVKYKALGTLMKQVQSAGQSGSATPARAQFAQTLGLRAGLALRDGHIIERSTQVVHGDKSISSAALAARLSADPEVEYAVPDLRRHILAAPGDPLYAINSNAAPAINAGQWYLRAPDSTFVSAINAEGAWAVTTGLASVVVADIDTGVLFNHPDLVNKLLPGRNFVSTNGNTGVGWSADASDPGDWTTTNQCGAGQPAESSSWHGTQTASIIGAQTNNGVGMASVGYNVKVLPLRALGKCGGYDSDILAAMYWAGGLADPATGDPTVPANTTPAKVINMSLGSTGTCNAFYVAAFRDLVAAGVTVVVAAGNAEGLAVATPANCAGAVAVAGVRHTGTKVGYSSIGPEVAISAPAGNCVNLSPYSISNPCLYPILTALDTGGTTPGSGVYSYSDTVNYSVGTSFSTPMVAGTVALMLSVNPSLTPAQVKAQLQATARSFPPQPSGSSVPVCQAPSAVLQDECYCTTSTCGAGLLDVGAAVRAAAGNAAPTVSITASATTVTDGATLTFAGSATAPNGLSIASYAWAVSSGSGIASISGAANTASASVLTNGVGSFTVTLTVTDSAGASASTSSTVTVNAPATPTPNIASSSTVVSAGNSVTLDGSGSSVPSPVTIVGYQWAITSGAALASFTSSTNAATATVATAGTTSGNFTVQLTVKDSLGRQASTTKTVTVNPAAPTAAISASAATVTAGTNVTFDGSGSLAPTGRTIAGYQWSITSGGTIAAISGSATGASITVNTTAAGSFTVQLTVTDSQGATNSQTSTVTVNAAAAAPAAGGKGGGPMSPLWVLGLAVATAALVRTRRH